MNTWRGLLKNISKKAENKGKSLGEIMKIASPLWKGIKNGSKSVKESLRSGAKSVKRNMKFSGAADAKEAVAEKEAVVAEKEEPAPEMKLGGDAKEEVVAEKAELNEMKEEEPMKKIEGGKHRKTSKKRRGSRKK